MFKRKGKKMEILYALLKFSDARLKYSDIPKLRGYFANKFSQYPEFHNHPPDGSFNYSFPQIQYRIVNHHPALIVTKDALDIMKKVFFEMDQLNVDGKKFVINEKQIEVKNAKFGQTKDFVEYKLISPWMALNEKNFKKFKTANKIEQQNLLKNILRGNLLSLAKGFDYTIPDFEKISVEGYFKPLRVNFKNIKMLCFTGEFTTNFFIPDYLGIGKQSARGFGVVKKR